MARFRLATHGKLVRIITTARRLVTHMLKLLALLLRARLLEGKQFRAGGLQIAIRAAPNPICAACPSHPSKGGGRNGSSLACDAISSAPARAHDWLLAHWGDGMQFSFLSARSRISHSHPSVSLVPFFSRLTSLRDPAAHNSIALWRRCLRRTDAVAALLGLCRSPEEEAIANGRRPGSSGPLSL